VLGQTWVGHYGTNHKQSTRIAISCRTSSHPILRGVKDVWVQAGGYVGKPTSGEILTMAQPLNGMTPDSPADKRSRRCRASGRAATNPHERQGRPRFHLAVWHLGGHHERRLSPPARERHLLGAGLEDAIKPDLNIAFVGAAKPNTFGGGAYARGIKPEMYAGFHQPDPGEQQHEGPETKPKKKEQAGRCGLHRCQAIDRDGQTRPLCPHRNSRREEVPANRRDRDHERWQKHREGRQGHAIDDDEWWRCEPALDGDKNPAWGKGMTHTKENQPNPWWEVDLGSAQAWTRSALWSRSGFSDRLGGFTLQLLDEGRKAVFELKNVAAPEAMTIDVKGGGKLAYLTLTENRANPAVKGSGGGGNLDQPEPALVDVPADYKDPMPFAFSKGDVVAILGNGLPDRMQHDGWMETVLQSALPEMQVRFRNMSTSGDRPNSYPRSPGRSR
jgi:hypothetical protein